jgi:hypothetical protein
MIRVENINVIMKEEMTNIEIKIENGKKMIEEGMIEKEVDQKIAIEIEEDLDLEVILKKIELLLIREREMIERN